MPKLQRKNPDVRCCTVTVSSSEEPKVPNKVYCLKSNDWFSDIPAANKQVSDNISGLAEKQKADVACPKPKDTPDFVKKENDCRIATDKVPATITDCNTSSNTNRCCFVKGKDGVGHCYASGQAKRSDATNLFAKENASGFFYTTDAVNCDKDADVLTAGNCQDDNSSNKSLKNAPVKDQDCFRSLDGKCCKVTFTGTDGKKGTPICVKAAGSTLTRNSAVVDAKSYFVNLYGAGVTEADISCAEPVNLPEKSECGRGYNKKKWVDTEIPTHAENCTSDKENYCCMATGLGDKAKAAKCVKTVAIKDDKANKGNATETIEDKYTDLSKAPECSSSGFISASVVALFAFMALF